MWHHSSILANFSHLNDTLRSCKTIFLYVRVIRNIYFATHATFHLISVHKVVIHSFHIARRYRARRKQFDFGAYDNFIAYFINQYRRAIENFRTLFFPANAGVLAYSEKFCLMSKIYTSSPFALISPICNHIGEYQARYCFARIRGSLRYASNWSVKFFGTYLAAWHVRLIFLPVNASLPRFARILPTLFRTCSCDANANRRKEAEYCVRFYVKCSHKMKYYILHKL